MTRKGHGKVPTVHENEVLFLQESVLYSRLFFFTLLDFCVNWFPSMPFFCLSSLPFPPTRESIGTGGVLFFSQCVFRLLPCLFLYNITLPVSSVSSPSSFIFFKIANRLTPTGSRKVHRDAPLYFCTSPAMSVLHELTRTLKHAS